MLDVGKYNTGGITSGTEAVSDAEGMLVKKEKKKKKVKHKEHVLLQNREKAQPEKLKCKRDHVIVTCTI